MATGTLMVHNPKFEAKLTNLPALRALPQPPALGPMHKPVPHAVLVEAIEAEADQRGFAVEREQLALARDGHALFGVLDLAPKHGLLKREDRGVAFGFRNSTDASIAVQGVAGSHVFVCDNLTLSGSVFAFKRKNTTGLDLGDAVARGFDKFLQQTEVLDAEIVELEETPLNDTQAKELAYEVFAERIVPVRLLDDVNRFYFDPQPEMTDCMPRSKWGLYNAFTRAMRDLSPQRLFGASVALGKFFRLGKN